MKIIENRMTNYKLPFQLESSWSQALEEELKLPYVSQLSAFIDQERAANGPIYPPIEDTFNAFFHTPLDRVKVVIIGQDPYHGPGQAEGLSFSVARGVPIPPSLQNIFKELKEDLGVCKGSHGSLGGWAKQGVLLLNAILTVRKNSPLSHQKKGWERLTDAVVKKLLNKQSPLVFLLWGNYAKAKCLSLKDSFSKSHLLLTAPHPSPFSAHSGFFGCRHFSKVNAFLIAQGDSPIDWQL